MRRWLGAAALVLLVCASCESSPQGSPVPTLTLIAPTATHTPTPAGATATPSVFEDPLLTAPTLLPPSEPTHDDPLVALMDTDPVAAELVRIAQRLVAEQRDLPIARIRVIEVQSARWTDSALGCVQENQIVQPMEVDGYRIVLSAGDQLYLFHADFDRVIPCAVENLPAPLAEATAEATPAQ